MNYFLKIILVGLCVFSLFSCAEIISEILGLNGDIDIISPASGVIVPSSTITVEVEATYDYIDEITLDVNGEQVHTTSESSFSRTVSLKPGENTITATCYAFESEDDIYSDYAGSDTIQVDYDNQDPELFIESPENWSTVKSADVTITGTVDDNYEIEALYCLAEGTWNQIGSGIGGWSHNIKELSEGTHSYLFKAEDVAGRTVVNAVTFVVDLSE